MRSLGFREINEVAEDHTYGEWQSRDLNPEPIIFPLLLAPAVRDNHGRRSGAVP